MNDFILPGWRRPSGALVDVILGVLIVALLSGTWGCGTLANGRRWGEDAFSHVSAAHVARAARHALFDVQTLLPATTAVIFAAADLDEPASDWITDHTPVFQSPDTARNVSDYLNWTLQAETLATLLATPSGSEPQPWWQSKAKGFAAETLAAGVPLGTTALLKRLTNRKRPDGSDRRSFPSGHASSIFSMATLANRNLDDLDIYPWLRSSLQVGNIAMASTAGWARVAGGKHFPSDVLAGAAIGHFFSAFLHEALTVNASPPRFKVLVLPSKDETMAYLIFPF